MRFTFLGTGTSSGVPVLGCQCRTCLSHDPRDHRLRTAGLLETGHGRILIDCGPDIRQQLLGVEYRKIDAVLLTHIHYDHVAGIDDLRPYCKFGDIDIYAQPDVVSGLHQTMPYCFGQHLYPGVPRLCLHNIHPFEPLQLAGVSVMPLQVYHDQLPILGFRIDSFGYITDMKTINPRSEQLLRGVDTLVVNGLRFECEHHSHQLIPEAVSFAQRIGARRTYLVHVTHDIGLHDEAQARLPKGAFIAYDGLEIEV